MTLDGINLNRIGLGTNRLTDTEANRDFLRFAVKSGVNFIDTAYRYTGGASETTIGNTFSPYPKELVVATKGGMADAGGGDNSESFLRSNLEASLKRLKTDCITLYQLHRLDASIPIKTTMQLLKAFQTEGKISHIGLSEVSLEQLEEARQYVDITSVQNHYSLTKRMHDSVLEYCSSNNIIFIPFFPLRDVNDDPSLYLRLKPMADRYKVTVQQLVLAWLLKRSSVMLPIPGTLSKEHLKTNLAASQVKLSQEDFDELTSTEF